MSPSGRPLARVATSGAACMLLLSAVAAAQESRQLRRIERPAAALPRYEGPAVPLPTVPACERAVRAIAADYGAGRTLEPWLAPDFPHREELLDTLERMTTRASRVVLEVMSVESARIEPWSVDPTRSTGAGQHLVTHCIADVRTRLVFDDPVTGRRTAREIGRGQWRLRYEREMAP